MDRNLVFNAQPKYFFPMRKSVILGSFLISALLAAVNNLVNPKGVAWFGSPEILPKPEGWPSEPMSKGIAGAFEFAWKGLMAHWPYILGGVILVALGIALLKRFRGVAIPLGVASALRLGLGVMFLFAAWPKFTNPEGFARMVAQYQFLPAFAVNGFTLWLSSFETVVGLGIILTAWEREFSALVGLLLLMFIVALSQALFRDLGIACGCFDIEGASSAGETWFALLRDIILLIPTAWLVAKGAKRHLWQPGLR